MLPMSHLYNRLALGGSQLLRRGFFSTTWPLRQLFAIGFAVGFCTGLLLLRWLLLRWLLLRWLLLRWLALWLLHCSAGCVFFSVGFQLRGFFSVGLQLRGFFSGGVFSCGFLSSGFPLRPSLPHCCRLAHNEETILGRTDMEGKNTLIASSTQNKTRWIYVTYIMCVRVCSHII